MKECNHKIKKNYPFGRKSTADKYCKVCGEVIKNKEIRESKKEKTKLRKIKR